MPISYPLNLPNITGITSINVGVSNAVGMTESPFSYSQQVQDFGGQKATAAITLPPLTREQADVWEAFLLKLRGSFGTFLMGDSERELPKGAVPLTDTPRVINAAGNTVDFKNCTKNITRYLAEGDYVQLGEGGGARLYRVLFDADTDDAGFLSLQLSPDLRSLPAVGDTLFFQNCVGVFRLVGNQRNFNRVPLFTSITFNATEVIDGT